MVHEKKKPQSFCRRLLLQYNIRVKERLSGDLNAIVCNNYKHIFGLSLHYFVDQGQQQPVLSYPATQLPGTQYQDSDGRDYTPIDMPIPAPVRYQLDQIKINVIKNNCPVYFLTDIQ
jgi:hypothetical protein